MRKFTIIAATLLAAAGAPVGASAQSQGAPDCRDDRGVDRCVEEQQRRMRALYGVPSIEEHRAAGDQVRRVFYVDGYGRDLVLISFVRAAGRDPMLRIHHPSRDGRRAETREVPVPQQSWDEVVQRSADFHRSFVPEAVARPQEVSICMHSWIYAVEAVDRPRGQQPATVRRKTEDACDRGPAAAYAHEMQRIALGLVPECAALDPRLHRNQASMLSACRALEGDRLAAAEVMNRAEGFRSIRDAQDAQRLAGLFAHATVINWSGTDFRGPGHQAPAFWAGRLGASRANLYLNRAVGENADRVRLFGQLSRSVDTPAGESSGTETASVEQLWVRDINGEFSVERATVGPWQRRSAR